MYMRITTLSEKFGAYLRALCRNKASTEHNMLLQVLRRLNPTSFKSFSTSSKKKTQNVEQGQAFHSGGSGLHPIRCVCVVVEGQTYRQNDATVSMKKKLNVAGMTEGGEDNEKHVCVCRMKG